VRDFTLINERVRKETIMLSILRPDPPLDPAVRKKLAHLRIFGIPCVLGLFLLAIAFFPTRIFWLAACAESLLCPYLIRKIHSLRNPS
jgi:hypothetical protein